MRRIDVRVIAATNRDLAAEVAAGRFRSDLYYRLTPLTIDVPPLRDRPEDVPVLVRYFVRALEERWEHSLDLVSDAIRSLNGYPFPGNVRELRNLVLRAAAASCSGRIESIPVPQAPAARGSAGRRRASTHSLAPVASAADGRANPAFQADVEWHAGANGRSDSNGYSNGSGAAPGATGSSSARSGGLFPVSDVAILPAGVVSARSIPSPKSGKTASGKGNGEADKAETLSLDGATAAHLRKVLSIAKGNVSQAARILDIPRTTLQSKLRRYGVD
jgi:transcriptional regulator with GAF, ATPase, and Fis domain